MITGNFYTDASLVILFLPLLAFVINILFGKKLPRQGDWISISAILTTLVLALILFAGMLKNWDYKFSHEVIMPWIDMGAFKIELGFWVDNITIVMLLVVALISSMTHIFSLEYMKGDIRYNRYYAYLGLFTFSMNGIVLANNLMSLYIFWELVGVSSYLLIGHWFEKNSAADASKKAFLTNRVGDIGFFIGIMLMFTAIGSFNFQDVFAGVSNGEIKGNLLTLAGLGLFMGAVGKSSQFPLHIWLPDAMEGPTPVSALMHAATMVAAGVYLTVRLFPIFTPDALVTIAYVGGFTAIFAASIAITQNDIKKVLAYSTVSQLGYMILAVGVGNYTAAFFHLLTHAMFKACLFYGSGSVIHAMHHSLHDLHDHDTDPQDMRNMGGFHKKMPITSTTMTLATLAIAGVPLFSGFLSKDAILAGTLYFVDQNPQHMILAFFGFGAAAITAFYMFRLIFLTFHGEPKMPKVFEGIHESPSLMTAPLVILAALSTYIFYTLPINLIPWKDYGWFTKLIKAKDSVVAGTPSAKEIYDGVHYMHDLALVLSLTVASIGIGLSFLMYYRSKISSKSWAKRFGPLYRLSLNKYYFDEIYNRVFYQPFLKLCNIVAIIDWDLYDKYFINGFGHVTKLLSKVTGQVDYDGLDQTLVDGVGRSAGGLGKGLKNIQTGRLQNYMLFALIGVIIILIVQYSVIL